MLSHNLEATCARSAANLSSIGVGLLQFHVCVGQLAETVALFGNTSVEKAE